MAAAFLPVAPLVCAAFFAAVERLLAVRLDALFFACADKARFDTAAVPSRFNALVVARLRAVDFFAAVPDERFRVAGLVS
ncbi:hypothetical protein BJI69_15990 [Luteibacter rhizovicinus DSM 16549]|uniref:Uncharacterized protein n=1 Tax=Luteibacter rhizovicinus DSM 16549 TaxID=1440763 RepID=A0A1L3EW41_9GAMM|nr:hypothetical protein BJI69_15990 [Luteibacter rhizovicinus DSM 16549]